MITKVQEFEVIQPNGTMHYINLFEKSIRYFAIIDSKTVTLIIYNIVFRHEYKKPSKPYGRVYVPVQFRVIISMLCEYLPIYLDRDFKPITFIRLAGSGYDIIELWNTNRSYRIMLSAIVEIEGDDARTFYHEYYKNFVKVYEAFGKRYLVISYPLSEMFFKICNELNRILTDSEYVKKIVDEWSITLRGIEHVYKIRKQPTFFHEITLFTKEFTVEAPRVHKLPSFKLPCKIELVKGPHYAYTSNELLYHLEKILQNTIKSVDFQTKVFTSSRLFIPIIYFVLAKLLSIESHS